MDKTHKDKLDRVFSEYIRKRDTKDGYFICISCGRRLPYGQADCGHYINRRHLATRWDEENCNAQCRKCNRFDEGNIQGYRRGLVRKIGEQHVILLESRKYRPTSFSNFEADVLIAEYQRLIKELNCK